MSTNGLSPPGRATYSTNSMYVGDGTWDSERNDFLLPNLQGLNFATMQYNGMGNRFRGLPQYHTLTLGHGILAAIVFIFMVPAAIFIARFWHSNGHRAFKAHVYIQILVVFLTTVIVILGYFAVGPERSLTNPHHGIGIAIYVCILVQFLFGWLMYRGERKRKETAIKVPLRLHLHRLFGRSIAILGFVQIALGLTLYGSPKSLFILYALAGALLLFMYFALAYQQMNRERIENIRRPPMSDYYTDYTGSYMTESQTAPTTQPGGRRKEESHWGRDILAAVGVFGAYEWWKSRRDKKKNEKGDRYTQRIDSRLSRPTSRFDSRPTSQQSSRLPATASQYGPSTYGAPSQYATSYRPSTALGTNRPPPGGGYGPGRPSQSRISSETWEHADESKLSQRKPQHTWRDRILAAGAGFAAFEGIKSLFGRKKNRQDDRYESGGRYRPPTEADQSSISQTDVSRVEAGQAPFSPNDRRRPQNSTMDTLTTMSPSRPPPRRRPSIDSLDYSDDESNMTPRRPSAGAGRNHTLRDSIAAFGVIAGLREWNKHRKQRKVSDEEEKIRQQTMEEEERYKHYSSGHYPLPEHAQGRRHSMSGTLMTGPDPALGSNPELSLQNFRPDTTQPPLPATAGTIPIAPTAIPPAAMANAHMNQSLVHQPQQQPVYSLPPPPPGPPPAPPGGARPTDYYAPPPGSLQMPQGAVEPDPSRLLAQQSSTVAGNHAAEDALVAGAAGAAISAAAAPHSQPQSPSRFNNSRTRLPRTRRQSSVGSASMSQVNPSAVAASAQSPPVSLKVKMHNDGRHVTLRRLNEEEAAAERAARRSERRTRRGSSLSSNNEDNSSRYRRNAGGVRQSSQLPITNVPFPPGTSNSNLSTPRPAPSDLPVASSAGPSQTLQASITPSAQTAGAQSNISPPPHQGLSPGGGPASSGAFPNITSDVGTGTDVSAFDSNRRRRRAERARRDAAAKGNRVEFE